MLYLLDTELKEKINISASLTQLFGVGNYKSTRLCKKLGFAENLKISDLNKNQKLKFIKGVENYSASVGFSLKQKLLYTRVKLLNNN
jgi:ribosomal protein S13